MHGEVQSTTIQCLAKRSKTSRNAVTNGKRWVQGDQRSPWARRFRDLIALHAEDLGGVDTLSQAQMALIRRAATIETELERQEAALANGGAIDLDAFNRASGGLRRLFETLGMRRVRKDVTPSLHSYVAKHANDPDPDD